MRMSSFFPLTLILALTGFAGPSFADSPECKFDAAVNPFSKFAGDYKVISYKRTCGGEACGSPEALQLSITKAEGTAMMLKVAYNNGHGISVEIPNDHYEDEYYRLDLCGNDEMVRWYLENKDDAVETRILMIKQFHNWMFLLDDGYYSESLVLEKQK